MKEGKFEMRYLLMIVSLFIIVGCSQDQEPENNLNSNLENEHVASDKNISFGILDVITQDGKIEVTGEARSTEDSFYYILEYGEELIKEEVEIDLNDEDEDWRTFSFEIDIKDEGLTDEEVPLLTLYVKDDGEVINPNYIPVDLMIY